METTIDRPIVNLKKVLIITLRLRGSREILCINITGLRTLFSIIIHSFSSAKDIFEKKQFSGIQSHVYRISCCCQCSL